MDAPGTGGMQDVPNLVSNEYDSENVMINGDDDEVDDDNDDDDDKDYDFEAESDDDAYGSAHQAFQGEHLCIVMECMTQPGNCRFST